jgi:transposase
VKKLQAEEKKQRKKRAPEHTHGRPRSAPTQIVEHRIVTCPDCRLRVGGISLARVREVIDVPPPPSVDVTHHRMFKGWCAGCQTWQEAPVDVHTEVLGQGRRGVRLSRLIATVRTVMRVPIRQIRQVLLSVHGGEVSSGEIVEVLHRISTHAHPLLADLKATIRASPAVQADDTGWREDGLNGSLWSVRIPTARYYESHHSRAGDVVTQVLGETFQGVLGSDVYAGYTLSQGFHQRCWVHSVRDIHTRKDTYPNSEEVWRWAKALTDVSDHAVAWVAQGPDPGWSPRQRHQMRVAQHHVFEQQLWAICQPYVGTTAPQQTVCTRVEDVGPERCVFVAVPGVPAHNHLAERSVRPLVIARTISGGTRSPKGSETRMSLARLFGTWMAQGLHPFSQCLALLTQPNPFG